MKYSLFIQQVLKEVSSLALEKFGHVSATTKPEDSNQVLTEADLLIGKTIIAKIKDVYPKHNIIDEEAGVIDNKSEFTWVIDPIDGTSNFAAGSPLYGIMIGLLFHNQPIAGGISLPAFSEIYTAEKEKGCCKNDRHICIPKDQKLAQVLIAYGIDADHEHPEQTQKDCQLLAEIILRCRNLRMSNSAFDVGMVVTGAYGATLSKTNKVWDNVAPQILIEEAGGVYTDFYGKPMDYSRALQQPQENFTFCAGAPEIHKQLQAIITKVS